MIAKIIIKPPIKVLTGGISFKNSQTHIGAHRVSESIRRPIVVEGVDLDPIVMHINPNANCGTPRKKPIKISWLVKAKDSERINP